MENKKIVILMRAPSGFGKSTWIRNNTVPDKTAVCSADDFFVARGHGKYAFDPKLLARKSCLDKFRAAMAANIEVIVVDNTNLRKSWYKDYVSLAKENGYKVFQKCLLTERFVNTHGVPEKKVEQMIASFEVDDSLEHYPV